MKNLRIIVTIFWISSLLGMEENTDPYQEAMKTKKMNSLLFKRIQQEKKYPRFEQERYAAHCKQFPTHTIDQYRASRDETEQFLRDQLQITQQNIDEFINKMDNLELDIPWKQSNPQEKIE